MLGFFSIVLVVNIVHVIWQHSSLGFNHQRRAYGMLIESTERVFDLTTNR